MHNKYLNFLFLSIAVIYLSKSDICRRWQILAALLVIFYQVCATQAIGGKLCMLYNKSIVVIFAKVIKCLTHVCYIRAMYSVLFLQC